MENTFIQFGSAESSSSTIARRPIIYTKGVAQMQENASVVIARNEVAERVLEALWLGSVPGYTPVIVFCNEHVQSRS